MKKNLMIGLTAAGVIPFVVLTAIMHWNIYGEVGNMIALTFLLKYTYVILAFIAGIYWGIALLDNRPCLKLIIFSNAVVILIWGASLIAQVQQQLAVLLACLVCLLFVDLDLFKAKKELSWYLKLRIVITAIVSLCLFVIMCQ